MRTDTPVRRQRRRPAEANRAGGIGVRRIGAAAVVAALTLGSLGVLATAGSAAAADTLLSQGKPVTASSIEGEGTPAAAAVDGNPDTRWSSEFSDPQWLQVDLGASATISRVELDWEYAHAKAFSIETSADAKDWTPIYTTKAGPGGNETLDVTGKGRYVRMYGTTRDNGYGYSLWEFKVFGSGGGGGDPTSTPTTSATPTDAPTDTPTGGPTSTPTGTATTGASASATVDPTTQAPSGPTTDPVDIPGAWTPVWADKFDGPAGSAPSGSDWLERTGTQYPGGAANWGTGSVETATDSTSNVALNGDGKLAITAVKDGAGKWTSGRIETKQDDFAAAPGEQVKFSAVLKQPDVANALGYWPGFRATGAAYRTAFNNWPGVGESDIMTDVNGRSQLSQTLHCGTAPGGACNEYDGRTSGLASCPGCQTGYHEYSQVIDRSKTNEEVRFYLDGHQTWVVQESQVGVKAWEAALHHGFYLRLDLAVGGSLPNANAGTTTPTDGTTSGGVLSVDSVSVEKIAAGTVPSAMDDPATPAGPSVVKVTGSQGNWALTVNDQPWTIKGLTYGPPQGAADGYIRDLKAAGVNTLRTWGVDDTGSPTLLNSAAQQGMKVIMGEWLNQGADYVNDQAYKDATKASILAQVNALKGYQGLLMWDVGNEVILTMQDHGLSAAEVEARRVAYAKYVDELAVAIHAADPNHPVTSTDAYTGAWPYYKQYAPHLDLMAVNSYGAIGNVKKDWIDGGYTKPYIVTEGGPAGEWEVPNDVNGVPTEPTDLQKRAGYTASWDAIVGHPGVALGGTEFHYGTENDFGGVWLNTFTGGWHRLGFYALQKAFTGQAAANTPPEITGLDLSSETSVPAGGQFTVKTTATDPDGDLVRYNLMYDNKYVPGGGTGLTNAKFTETAPGQFTATAPASTGVWKVYVYAFDGHGNVGIEQKSFKVVAPTVPGTNIAKGKDATASSFQPTGPNGPQSPALAVDGDIGTRWASEWLVDPEWIQVDLGSNQTFDHVQLAWESAYAKSYKVQTSTDGTNWTDYYSTTAGDGGFDQIDKAGSGRYVRMTGTVRALADYGYSLYEFGIYKS